ncbi:MAG: hypothetical protein SFV21_14680 [Rhodospirillaceae bacterium]|nr:hypothetical protein [Rhodospirillaceae bacterium]
MGIVVAMLGAIVAAAGAAPDAAAEWTRTVVVPPMNGAAPGIGPHGLTGIGFGPDGALYGGSVAGPGIYRFDLDAETVTEVVGAPAGEADDVALGPAGTPAEHWLAWTAILACEVRARRPDGEIVVLARDLPMINPIAFLPDGRLLAGQASVPGVQSDTLLEIDLNGGPPRTLARDLGGINAFAPGADGASIIIPRFDRGGVARVDLATGTVSPIADGLGVPAAVKRDSQGGLYAIDWPTGRITYVNPDSGETIRVATVPPPLDNIAIGPDDTLYVSRPPDNAIIAVNRDTGEHAVVFSSGLAAPGGVVLTTFRGRPALAVADIYGYRFVDPVSGAVTLLPFDTATNASSAIAVDERRIVLVNVRRNSLTIIDRDAAERSTVDAPARATATVTDLNAPMGVALSPAGEILVANYGTGDILRLMPGAANDRTIVARGLRGPVGLAFGADGALYVSEATSGAVSRVDRATGDVVAVAMGLSQPEALAALPDGRLAVIEAGAGRLSIVDPVLGSVETIATGLATNQVFTRAPAPVYLPGGVTAGDDGAIYVVCDRDNSLLKFTPRESTTTRTGG